MSSDYIHRITTMLSLYTGTDFSKRKEAIHTVLTEAGAEAAVYQFEADSCTPQTLQEFAHTPSLFANSIICYFLYALATHETRELVTTMADELVASPTHFIFSEETLPKKFLAKLKKHGAAVYEYQLPTTKQTDKTKQLKFACTDALGGRDRKALWLAIQQARLGGVSAEELLPLMIWQIKTMRLVAQSQEKPDTMNAFVYKKSVSFVRNYSHDELHAIAERAITLFHELRRSQKDPYIALERFALSL